MASTIREQHNGRTRYRIQFRDADGKRRLILDADISRYRIAKETGLTQAGLSRYVNYVAGLSLDSIDKTGDCLDLEIVAREQAPRKRKSK